MALTGARLNGKELITAGLATHFVPSEVHCNSEIILGILILSQIEYLNEHDPKIHFFCCKSIKLPLCNISFSS